MKKIVLVAVMALCTMTAFAQEETNVETVASEVTEAVVAQDDFAEVAVAELPEAVVAAVAKNYPTATIDKAYLNEASQYKLEVSLEDGTAGTLFADAEGNWIEL